MNIEQFATCAVLILLVCPAARADVLADYDIKGNSPGTSYIGPVPVNSTADHVTAQAMEVVGVSNISSSGNKSESLGGNSWNSAAFDINDEYIGFSLAPAAGLALDIDAIYFNEAANNPFASGPGAWELRSSLDGFGSVVATGTITSGFQNINSAGFTKITLDSTFDNVSSNIEFRLYGNVTNFGDQWFVTDPSDASTPFTNFTVEGAVVPEPASTALVGLGLAFCLARYRR